MLTSEFDNFCHRWFLRNRSDEKLTSNCYSLCMYSATIKPRTLLVGPWLFLLGHSFPCSHFRPSKLQSKSLTWSLPGKRTLVVTGLRSHSKEGCRKNPRRRSEIPGPFLKLFWVTNIIIIIKWGPNLPITAKIRNKRWRGFICFSSSIVSSRRHRLRMANEVNEVLLGKRPR